MKKNTELSELLLAFLNKAQENKKVLVQFKNNAVAAQEFELASHLRQLETTIFPESDEVKKEKDTAKDISRLFKLVGIDTSDKICWVANQVISAYRRKKGNFSIRDASEIGQTADRIFDL